MSDNAGVKDQQNKGILRTVAVLLGVVILVLVMVYHKFTSPRILSDAALQERGVLIFEQPRKLPSLNLLDKNGQVFSKADFEGAWSLVFFGFTQCPDICPMTLAELKRLYVLLDPYMQERLRITLLSLDPERGTPEKVKQYVNYFSEDFVALTASHVSDTAMAARAFNVAYMKQPIGDSYTIDHSTHLAIVNPNGDYHGLIKAPLDASFLVEVVKSLERAW